MGQGITLDLSVFHGREIVFVQPAQGVVLAAQVDQTRLECFPQPAVIAEIKVGDLIRVMHPLHDWQVATPVIVALAQGQAFAHLDRFDFVWTGGYGRAQGRFVEIPIIPSGVTLCPSENAASG